MAREPAKGLDLSRADLGQHIAETKQSRQATSSSIILSWFRSFGYWIWSLFEICGWNLVLESQPIAR
jgi:hypothetical protein